jgi:hypothetical protein
LICRMSDSWPTTVAAGCTGGDRCDQLKLDSGWPLKIDFDFAVVVVIATENIWGGRALGRGGSRMHIPSAGPLILALPRSSFRRAVLIPRYFFALSLGYRAGIPLHRILLRKADTWHPTNATRPSGLGALAVPPLGLPVRLSLPGNFMLVLIPAFWCRSRIPTKDAHLWPWSLWLCVKRRTWIYSH